MNISRPIPRVLLILLLAFIPYWLTRTSLYFYYGDVFSTLGADEVVNGVLHGFRFDASAVIKFIGLPLLFILLPFSWARSWLWQGFWHWFIFIAILISVLLLIADFIYFGFVNRHVGAEISLFTGDPDLMWDIAVSEHGLALLAFILAAVFGAYKWHQIFKEPLATPKQKSPYVLAVVTLFALFLVIGRGGFQYKPIGVADAFAAGPPAAAYLALNGAFAVQYSLARGAPKSTSYMPEDEATRLVRAQVAREDETFLNDDYPLMRTSSPMFKPKQPPNIVVILFESWDAIHTDVVREAYGKPPLGVTPVFDELSRQGRLYTNFFAAGRRSMDGLAAVLASMTTLPNLPYIGKGMEQNRLSFLGEMAKKQGYETIFLQSSKRGSFHIDAIASTAGFERYYGAEDIPLDPSHSDRQSDWGVWDYETFIYANKTFSEADKPFLGFIFTSSTHNPWRVPKEEWEHFTPDSDLNRYLNTMAYADWSLGEFIKSAKKAGYYDNTIFLLTGDHIGRFNVEPGDVRGYYHLPLLVFGPGVEPGVDDRLGSQLDILPSIMDLAGWQDKYAAMGRSLFAKPLPQRGLFGVNGSLLEWIAEDGVISHNLQRRVRGQRFDEHADLDSYEQSLLATYQTVNNLQLQNRVLE